MGTMRTPDELREGVRSAIADRLKRDAELRGGRTARLLVAAGALGVFGALGMIRIIYGHPYDHHPAWHVVVFGAIWSGLLVVALAIAFLQVRTPSLPLGRAARIALLGLGIAGICSAFCPDQHFLAWWSGTRAGEPLADLAGLPLSALCFGLLVTLLVGAVATFIALRRWDGGQIGPLLPAVMLFVLLAPGVALQSFGSAWTVFAGWLIGTGIGSYAGIAVGIAARTRLSAR
jgi:hypothetical protein